MLFYMVETIIIVYIENNIIKFQNNNSDSKVLVLYRGNVPGKAIGLVWSIVYMLPSQAVTLGVKRNAFPGLAACFDEG